MEYVNGRKFKDNRETIEEVQKECNQKIENVYGKGNSLLFKDVIKYNRKSYISGEDGKIVLSIVNTF